MTVSTAMFEPILNERRSRINRLHLFALIGLMLLGSAFVYSATMASETAASLPLSKPQAIS